MSKNERKQFMINRYRLLAGVALAGFIPVSKGEIRETAKETKSLTATNDEIQDEETLGVTPSLSFDRVRVGKGESEENFLLDSGEKAELAREVSRLRFVKSISSQLLLTA